jgi:hypothetical protein
MYALRPTNKPHNVAYPSGGGVVLRLGEGVLSFAGICALTARMNPGDLRERIDVALRAGVLRRGMVLRCKICQSKQFQTIDKIGQLWTCERCDAANDLDHHVWPGPIRPDPDQDVTEVEFVQDGAAQVEVDLSCVPRRHPDCRRM